MSARLQLRAALQKLRATPVKTPYVARNSAASIAARNERKALFRKARAQIASAANRIEAAARRAAPLIASHVATFFVAMLIAYVVAVQPARDEAEQQRLAAIERAAADEKLIKHYAGNSTTLTVVANRHDYHAMRAMATAIEALEPKK